MDEVVHFLLTSTKSGPIISISFRCPSTQFISRRGARAYALITRQRTLNFNASRSDEPWAQFGRLPINQVGKALGERIAKPAGRPVFCFSKPGLA